MKSYSRSRPVWIYAMVAAAGLAAGAEAADVAVLINNNVADAETVAALTVKLNAGGYEVQQRTDATRDDLAVAFKSLSEGLDDTERLILVFFGEARVALDRTWLIPDGLDGDTAVDVAFGGVDAGVMLALAGTLPGRAAVMLGQPDDEATGSDSDLGPLAVRSGAASMEVPQGVLFAAGPALAVATALDRLLTKDVSVADAMANMNDGLNVSGFLSPDFSFMAGDAVPVPPGVAVQPEESATVLPEAAEESRLGLDQAARRNIQERLTVLGFDTRGIDGLFGPGTRSAVSEWQKTRNLSETGYVTSEQIKLLSVEADERSAELAAKAELVRQKEEAADAAFWQSTGANGRVSDLRVYLERYPDGIYAEVAQTSLDKISAKAKNAAAAEDRKAWDVAASNDKIKAYRRYLKAFPEGAFAEEAKARIADLKAGPAKAQADAAAAAAEEAMGLNGGSRALIEGQLEALGYAPGATDGVFDKDTRKALRQFQTRQGLTVTGYVNQETVRSLIVASLVPR